MQKWFVSVGLSCGCAAMLVGNVSAQIEIQIQAQAGQAQAARIALPIRPGFGGGNRLAPVDAIFVGRVIAMEPMDVEAMPAEGQAKVKYRVAVVQISESIHGLKKDTKQVRVAFVTQGNAPLNGPGGGIQIQPFPGGGPRRPFPGNFQTQLQMGQEGLFRVNKHAKETFYLSPNYTNFVAKENNANFDNEVKTTKQVAKVMGDPVKALKADDKQDRYIAAALLISKYRNPENPTGKAIKQEPIDAAESKLILQALAGGDWKVGVFNAAIPGPFELFNQLGVSNKDGYSPMNIRTQEDIHTAMQKWIDENNGKYRINKMVIDPNAKVQPGIQPGTDVQPVPPVKVRPGVRIQPGKVQILPAPAVEPVPAPPVQIDPIQVLPQAVPAPAPQPIRRN